ncbi:hypothetical protein ACXZ1M_24345 [Duganella sp. PWIR1]
MFISNDNYRAIKSAGFDFCLFLVGRGTGLFIATDSDRSPSEIYSIKDKDFLDYINIIRFENPSDWNTYRHYCIDSFMRFSKLGSELDEIMLAMIDDFSEIAATKEGLRLRRSLTPPSAYAPRKTSKRL